MRTKAVANMTNARRIFGGRSIVVFRIPVSGANRRASLKRGMRS
jgi:hypothetical protein